MIPSYQSHSLPFLSTKPEKVPLDFVNSVYKFFLNYEEIQSISRDALEASFKESDFASLAQKVTLLASKFLIKILNEIILKGIWSIRPQRET